MQHSTKQQIVIFRKYNNNKIEEHIQNKPKYSYAPFFASCELILIHSK
jgi:hypothetical protein